MIETNFHIRVKKFSDYNSTITEPDALSMLSILNALVCTYVARGYVVEMTDETHLAMTTAVEYKLLPPPEKSQPQDCRSVPAGRKCLGKHRPFCQSRRCRAGSW